MWLPERSNEVSARRPDDRRDSGCLLEREDTMAESTPGPAFRPSPSPDYSRRLFSRPPRRRGWVLLASPGGRCAMTATFDPNPLDGTASLFAQILRETPEASVDAVFAKACQLADGLFPHQVEGVAFLLARRRAILADDMGLGKTRQAIVALREAAPDGPYLVVCPAGVKLNWAREIRAGRADADVRVVPAAGSLAGRRALDGRQLRPAGPARGRLAAIAWGGIVVDEAHYIKNDTSARTPDVRDSLGAAASGPAPAAEPPVYLLTGTPMTNRPRDLFNLLRAVRHPLGRQLLSATPSATAPPATTATGWRPTARRTSRSWPRSAPGVMLRRTKDEALDLPPKMRTWQPVEVPIERRSARASRRERSTTWTQHPPRDRGRTLDHVPGAAEPRAPARSPWPRRRPRSRPSGSAVEAGEKVVVFSSLHGGRSSRWRRRFGDAAVTITGSDAGRQRARPPPTPSRPTRRAGAGRQPHAAGVGHQR